jgi:hypothetical protein
MTKEKEKRGKNPKNRAQPGGIKPQDRLHF